MARRRGNPIWDEEEEEVQVEVQPRGAAQVSYRPQAAARRDEPNLLPQPVRLADDVVPGYKRGKGVQHLSSSYFVEDLAVFISANLTLLQDHLDYVRSASAEARRESLLG